MGEIKRISIFPLTGVILFPGLQIPLHIFEPRYRALMGDAMVRDRLIGMIQPRASAADRSERPDLFAMGTLSRIVDVEAMEDGRYNVILEGVSRFRFIKELDVATAFRQVEGELVSEPDEQVMASIERASLEREAQKFALRQGYVVDWKSVGQLDDVSLVNGMAQIAPFDAAAKQALLECGDIHDRADLIIQMMQFFGRRDSDDPQVTLQ